MNKKAFTLIELIAVITIIGLIATITVPIIWDAIKSSRDKAFERQKEMIIDAAKRYAADNATSIGETSSITIGELKDKGYLSTKGISNPKDKKEMNGCVEINYNGVYNQYEYSYIEDSKSCKKD